MIWLAQIELNTDWGIAIGALILVVGLIISKQLVPGYVYTKALEDLAKVAGERDAALALAQKNADIAERLLERRRS